MKRKSRLERTSEKFSQLKPILDSIHTLLAMGLIVLVTLLQLLKDRFI